MVLCFIALIWSSLAITMGVCGLQNLPGSYSHGEPHPNYHQLLRFWSLLIVSHLIGSLLVIYYMIELIAPKSAFVLALGKTAFFLANIIGLAVLALLFVACCLGLHDLPATPQRVVYEGWRAADDNSYLYYPLMAFWSFFAVTSSMVSIMNIASLISELHWKLAPARRVALDQIVAFPFRATLYQVIDFPDFFFAQINQALIAADPTSSAMEATPLLFRTKW